MTPSWPCAVKGSSAASHRMPIPGWARLTAATARHTRFSGLSASSPSALFSAGGTAGLVDQRRNGEPRGARHRGDVLASGCAVGDEDGPDEIGSGEDGLGDEAARPFVAPVAAQPDARIGAKGGEWFRCHVGTTAGARVWRPALPAARS